jgi:hypothetical protein
MSYMQNVSVNATGGFAGFRGSPATSVWVNLAVTGGQYGVMIDGTSGVSAIAGLAVKNQSVAGVDHASIGDLSISGFTIDETNTGAVGIISSSRIAQGTMVSLVDGEITVTGAAAISNVGDDSLYLNDVYVTAPTNAIVNAHSTTIASNGHLAWIKEYAHADQGTNPSTAGYAEAAKIVIDDANAGVDSGPTYGSATAIPSDLVVRHLPGQMPWAFDTNVAWVTDFGADPTGATDSTAAIQATIEAAHANGREEVFVPRGNYIISGTLVMHPNTKFFGLPGGYSNLNAPTWDTKGHVMPYARVGNATTDAAGSKAGHAIMSDIYFALPTKGNAVVTPLQQSYLTALDWQVGRSSVVNEVFSGFQWESGLSVPGAPARNIVQIGKTGGGRWYGLQLIGDYGPNATTGYELVAASTAPLSIYGSNIEHGAGAAFYGFVDASNVRVLGAKTEGGPAKYWFSVDGSSNVMISGITNHGSSPTHVTGSTNVNINTTGFYAAKPSSAAYITDDHGSYPLADNYPLFELGTYNNSVFPHCGDGVCDGGETHASCAVDCAH